MVMLTAEPASSIRQAIVTRSSRRQWFTPTHLDLATPGAKNSLLGKWTSRWTRKGRYQSVTHQIPLHQSDACRKSPRSTLAEDGEKRAEMESRIVALRLQTAEKQLKPHVILDVTLWLAIAFTLGSVIWVVNGFLVLMPILKPELASTTFTDTAAATGFIGGTIFEVGSYLMIVEALNRGRETAFDTELGRLLHRHRHAGPLSDSNHTRKPTEVTMDASLSSDKWVWWGKPMWHDLGYIAALIQLIAATVFWISTLTGLPEVISGLYTEEGSIAIIDAFFWTPQVIGGIGFILSALILMVEVQVRWYKPDLTDIGWYIGAWNLIGAVGFMLCGAIGYGSRESDGAAYQSALSTFWGGWAFLVGSMLQLIEAIWREPPPP